MPKKPDKKKVASKKDAERLRYLAWEHRVKTEKTNFSRSTAPAAAPSRNLHYNINVDGPRNTNNREIPSLTTGGGSTAPPPDRVYTGNKMLGVSVLHKSNGVPVFDHESIEDIARMRR